MTVAIVSDDETAFADELYVTNDGVRELAAAGMDIAGHGYAHRRFALLDETAQAEEIRRTKAFLGEPEAWAMCYPYGSRNETTLRLLAEAGCAL